MNPPKPHTANNAVPAEAPPPDPAFPLAHRTDLPEHERRISATALARLRAGVEDARVNGVRPLDLERYAYVDVDNDDDDE